MSDLHELTLIELSDALAAGRVSSTEATEHALRRIAAFDGRDGLNAFITVLPDEARASARAADTRRASGDGRGPLDGVPIALKDLFDTAGTRTTGGSLLFGDRVPDADATVVRKLRDAGAVILGKTNMMEFAYGHPHPHFGETLNPWHRARSAGGSSGGSAAAVAAGMAWGALGSDTGGSIRSPAAYCGVTGFKPTYGLLSCAGVLPLSWSLDHVGPFARTAADCALLTACLAGHDPADPASATSSTIDGVVASLAALLEPGNAAPSPSRGLRIGIVPQMFEFAVTPGLRAEVERALPVFADLGAEVVEIELEPAILGLILPTISRIYPVEAAAYHHRWLQERAADYGPILRAELEKALKVPGFEYVVALQDRRRIQAAFAALYDDADLLVWPSQPLVAPLLGTTDAVVDEPGTGATTIDVEIGATGPANLTGEPAISLPCGFVDGLPVGLHLQGPRFADARLAQVAMAFQAATGGPPLPELVATSAR